MVALVALFLGLHQSAGKPSDYFPDTPGTVLTYKDDTMAQPMIRTILPSINKEGMTLIPIETMIGTHKLADPIYYRIDDEGVYMVWLDSKGHPVQNQQPLFLWRKASEKWTFQGAIQVATRLEPLDLKGETRPGGIREILGNKVETIVVKLDAVITDGPNEIRSHQDLVLAKGIGIVEQQETAFYAKKKLRRTLKLVSFKMSEEHKD